MEPIQVQEKQPAILAVQCTGEPRQEFCGGWTTAPSGTHYCKRHGNSIVCDEFGCTAYEHSGLLFLANSSRQNHKFMAVSKGAWIVAKKTADPTFPYTFEVVSDKDFRERYTAHPQEQTR